MHHLKNVVLIRCAWFFNSRYSIVTMSGLWNEIVGLIGVLSIISIFFVMVASPEQIQQLLNTLITGLIMALIIAPAIAITLILINREYKKSETEW